MASTSVEPIETDGRLLRERVYEELRHDIVSCELMPGAEIREAELAARFEVSKSPVRDALISLEREGLVITIPRQGYRVAPVSISDMLDMFHLRAALERANIERGAQHGSRQMDCSEGQVRGCVQGGRGAVGQLLGSECAQGARGM
jgi:DNA-binding GntR family transcriptional regulator